MHIMIGFLLFCACLCVAIVMWRPLLWVAGVIGVLILIIIAANNTPTKPPIPTAVAIAPPVPAPPPPITTIKYVLFPFAGYPGGNVGYDITQLFSGTSLHCNGRIVSYKLAILDRDEPLKYAILVLGNADGVPTVDANNVPMMYAMRGTVTRSKYSSGFDIDLVGTATNQTNMSFNRRDFSATADVTPSPTEKACQMPIEAIPLASLKQ